MPESGAELGAQQSREILHDQIKAWWLDVLAGQVDRTYPVEGTNITAVRDGDGLTVRGTVPSQDCLEQVTDQLERLRDDEVHEIRYELQLAGHVEERRGLLAQTLMAMFENDEQAGFAKGYLEGHAHVEPNKMYVLSASDAPSQQALEVRLSADYWQDARRALDAGHSILIVTVDETEAFRVRELLDEETRSLETMVLPPQATAGQTAVHHGG